MLFISYLDVVILLVVAASSFLRHLSVYGLKQHLSLVLVVSFGSEDGLVLSDGFMERIVFFYLLDGGLHEGVVLLGVAWLFLNEGCFEHEELGTD